MSAAGKARELIAELLEGGAVVSIREIKAAAAARGLKWKQVEAAKLASRGTVKHCRMMEVDGRRWGWYLAPVDDAATPLPVPLELPGETTAAPLPPGEATADELPPGDGHLEAGAALTGALEDLAGALHDAPPGALTFEPEEELADPAVSGGVVGRIDLVVPFRDLVWLPGDEIRAVLSGVADVLIRWQEIRQVMLRAAEQAGRGDEPEG